MKTITKEMQQKLTPEQAIELLRSGNLRFAHRELQRRAPSEHLLSGL